MASANLDLVRSIYAAWERGDYSSVDWAHPEIDFEIADGPEPGSWKGLAGMAEGFRSIVNPWEDFRSQVEGYRELDGGGVAVLMRRSGRGKASGLELGRMSTKGVVLFQLDGGKVTRLVIYWDRERALADLGLAPENDERE